MDDNNSNQKDECFIISSDELLFILSQFIRLYQRKMYRARLPYVPYRGQNRVLHIIADNDGLNQKELAELLDIRSASMSELLNKLERSNLITREKDETDKRVTRVCLSAAGRELVNGSQDQENFAETLFEGLSDEEKYTFYTTLKKLCAAFEAQALLVGEDDDEFLPPHLRGDHVPPPPPEGGPVPPHLRGEHVPPPPGEDPVPPHLRGDHVPPPPPEGGPVPPHLRGEHVPPPPPGEDPVPPHLRGEHVPPPPPEEEPLPPHLER